MSQITDMNKAKEEIVKSVKDLSSLQITLALGNPALKYVHTNQMLFTELPKGVFDLENMGALSDALKSSYTRFSDYELGRYYIEGVTINNSVKGDATMNIDVNPFPSDLLDYKKGLEGFYKAYEDTFKQNNNTGNATNKTVKSTASKTKTSSEGKYIDKLTKKVIGKTTDPLKKAKKIHYYLLDYLIYEFYRNSKFNTPEQVHKAKRCNCADTSRLTASMLRSADVPCYVVHSTNHYYTVVKIDGKLYCTDAVGNKRKFNYFWSPSNRYNKFRGKSSYDRKCGKNPCS